MTGLAPLLLLWLWSRGTFGRAAPPQWPTPKSPPPSPPRVPDVPAFQSQPPPAPTADTATPLTDIHQAPPQTPPIPATRAAKRAARTINMPLQTIFARAPALKSAAVQDLQTLLIARGVKVQRDGLYGPKTANAWSALARSKKLPPTISRVGPKIAKVSTQTFEALKLPPIP